MKTWLLLILVALGSIVRSQSNYFNKTYVMPNINLASGIIEVDSSYYVVGQQLTPANKKMTLNHIDKYGNLIQGVSYEVDTLKFFPQKVLSYNDNIIVYGSFQQVNPSYPNNSRIFLASYTKNLQLNWLKTYGGNFYNAGKDFKITKDRGFIMTGSTTNGIGENFHEQVILIKTDSLGNVEWQKQYGAYNLQEFGNSIVELHNGDFVIGGNKQLIITNGSTILYPYDFYIIRTDSNGSLLWEKTFGSEFSDNYGFVSQLKDSSLLLSGANVTSLNTYDNVAYLCKLNIEGDILWEKQFSYGQYTTIYGSALETIEGNFIISGHVKDTQSTETKMYIGNYDYIGNEIWHRIYFQDSLRDQYIYNLIATKDGGYVMCGSAFDSSQIQRAWVVKTDCYGYDSVTYYFKDSICTLEDCYRYQEDAVFTVSSDTIDLNIIAELDVKNSNATNAQLTWSFGDGTQIENQASYTHMYQNPGTYEVQLLFEKGICSLSTKKTIVVLKPSVFNNFALYPNPNDGSFTLVNYLGKATELQLYDALGKLVFSSNITQTQTTFDLNLEIGVYFVTLGDELLQKMVISR